MTMRRKYQHQIICKIVVVRHCWSMYATVFCLKLCWNPSRHVCVACGMLKLELVTLLTPSTQVLPPKKLMFIVGVPIQKLYNCNIISIWKFRNLCTWITIAYMNSKSVSSHYYVHQVQDLAKGEWQLHSRACKGTILPIPTHTANCMLIGADTIRFPFLHDVTMNLISKDMAWQNKYPPGFDELWYPTTYTQVSRRATRSSVLRVFPKSANIQLILLTGSYGHIVQHQTSWWNLPVILSICKT